MTQLEGKRVLITGAKGGLGNFVTKTFLDAGAKVVGSSLSIKASDFSHPGFDAIATNLSSGAAANKLAADAIARLGGIDVLVHIMGGFDGGKSVAETSDDTLEKMLDMNYRAGFFIMRAVLPQMRKQCSGRILAVASRTALEPSAMVGAYTASKAALVSLVRTIAIENKDLSITANSVLPGTMDTPANRAAMPDADTSQWVDPSQVAALLAHLASDNASQITGTAIPVYGRQ